MARIGIDFGTTNSSVAYFDGKRLRPIELDPTNENPHVLPSLIYIDRAYQTRLGTQAAQAYLKRETGRRIVWERKKISPIEIIVAGSGSSPIHYWHDVHIITDTAANGRLLQSVKTALRDPRYEGTDIFERYYTIDELIAIILQSMKARAEAQLNEPCDQVVIGRPVRFSDDTHVTTRAEEILYRAARFAGFEEIAFQLEPTAAAHLYHINTPQREVALIFDFGGGTLDLTIAEVGGKQPPRVIATRGVLVGGDDLDRRIMHSLLPYFGKGTRVDGDLEFPPDFLDMLHTWQTMPELSRPQPLSKIRQFQKRSSNPDAMLALETLVTQNIGFDLFQHIEQTKKSLTDELMARLDFHYEHVDIHERILRRAFEALIEEELALVRREIERVVADAGMRVGHVDVVLRTGGTSLVPAFVHMLSDLFGHDKIREMDPLTSVVGGMAVVAHEERGQHPEYAYRYDNPFAYLQATSGRAYQHTILRTHRPCYTDRDYTIVSLPLQLSGLHAIKPADLDYDSEAKRLIRFKLTCPSKVYVIYLAKARKLPKWLRGFTRVEGLQVDVDSPGGRMPFFVYERDFPAGAFALGGAHADGYNGIVFMNYMVAAKAL
jgi:hypothetical chaperone protein